MSTDGMIRYLARRLYEMSQLHGLTVRCAGKGCGVREIGVPVGRVDAEMARLGWPEKELEDEDLFAGWLCPQCSAKATMRRKRKVSAGE